MAKYQAKVTWQRGTQKFTDMKFSRDHEWAFDDGIKVKGSCLAACRAAANDRARGTVDPEEAFVASLSSCHMLTFLYLRGAQGLHRRLPMSTMPRARSPRMPKARWR